MRGAGADPEAGAGVEDAGAEVKGGAVEVLLGDGLVGRIVVVVVAGGDDLRAAELLVEVSYLHAHAELALEKLDFVCGLCADEHIGEEAYLLLLHLQAEADALAADCQRRVGLDEE